MLDVPGQQLLYQQLHGKNTALLPILTLNKLPISQNHMPRIDGTLRWKIYIENKNEVDNNYYRFCDKTQH